MASANEEIIRHAYRVAEEKDIEGWVNSFTPDGTFTDESIGVTYAGPTELAFTVENYAKAFPDMHRELYAFYVTGNIVVVQLALQGTHLGPLQLPVGTILPTGKRMDAPCADVFELQEEKIKRFDCYPSGPVVLILVDTHRPHLSPLNDPVNTVVLNAGPADVDTVIVDGEIVKSGGALVGDIADQARELAAASSRRILNTDGG